MRKFIAIALASLFLANAALAASCADQALDKNGKPLKGAAKTAFMKKCEKHAATAACDTKAVGKDGKALKGAARASFIKKCEADANK